MVQVDARVREADGDTEAGAPRPRVLGVDLRQPPLTPVVGVVRRVGDVGQASDERCECDEDRGAEDASPSARIADGFRGFCPKYTY